jgi:hypothetical protein
MTASRRRLVTVLGLVAVSAFCVALVLVRFAESGGSTEYIGLIWNLVLAWIPSPSTTVGAATAQA